MTFRLLDDVGVPWKPLRLTVTNGYLYRSALARDAVLNALGVDTSACYQATAKDTFCSTYAWDDSRAMEVVMPHWTLADLTPCEPGELKDAAGNVIRREHTANTWSREWLPKCGAENGWIRTTGDDAQAQAEQGRPAYALWANPDGPHGHVAAVVPCHGLPGIVVSQAGARNFRRGSIRQAFGAEKLPDVEFWFHR